MVFKIVILSFCVFLFGCGAQQLKSPSMPEIKYSHPQYGVVIIPNEYHKADRAECTTRVYALGAEIGGVHVTDPEEIKKYSIDSILFATRESEMALRRELSELKRKPIDMTNLNHDPTKSEAYYAEATRLDNDINKCMAKKGWLKVQ